MDLDDEIINDYLAECREHLATIETDMLAIEERGSEIDEELVNRVFRAAHSIKGGAGFFDLNQIKELAHKTENVLDMIRSRRMPPAAEVVSVLLLAFDKLRDLIVNYRTSNQADISEFVDGLLRLTTDYLPSDQKHVVKERVSISEPGTGHAISASAFDLKQARASSTAVYVIQCDLIHDVQRRGKNPYDLIRTLVQHGTILETLFQLDSVGTLDDEPCSQLFLEVLYAADMPPEKLGELLEIGPDRIRRVDVAAAMAPVETAPAGVFEPAGQTSPAPVVRADPDPAPASAEPPAPALPGTSSGPADTTIRLNVALLDSLMTLAGELVLSRNQLNESLGRKDERGIRASAQRVSLVTSELQEAVSLTRMQPVGTVFSKFPRLVRDLARELGKEAQLRLEGAEVELDKTILEGLSDPLTHMIRNSVDHGIEAPDVRVARGKPRLGTITLKASHQAGQVLIDISDDGKGLDPDKVAAAALARAAVTPEQVRAMSDRDKMSLIMLPGVSTAEKVSNVSGRGVGMDVVKTNLDKLGGKIEIESAPGRGSSFRIKLPLTLAIIPSLLISDGGERFAIPQVGVGELIRIPAAQISQRIDRVGNGEVLILRDRLVPLLHLSDALGRPRREGGGPAWNVVLVNAGTLEYGLVVEELHVTVETVVKPLGRHIQGLPEYAGATILGDGRVALILDVAGLAVRAGLAPSAAQAPNGRENPQADIQDEAVSLLLFHNTPAELCAVPIYFVSRIERVRLQQIEYVGGRRTMQYRDTSMPVIALNDVARVGEIDPGQPWVVIVFDHGGRSMGLLASEPVDMIESRVNLDRRTLRQRGISGSAIIHERTTLIVDIHELAEATQLGASDASPGPEETLAGAEGASALGAIHPPGVAPTVLLAEDSDFFRGQLTRLIEGIGCNVLAAEDGQAAWELLDRHAGEVGLLTTDIEMPRMDGMSLARRIRADGRFARLPIIAVSTRAGEDEIAQGLAAGITEYQVKLNKDELVNCIRRVVDRAAGATACPEIEMEKAS